MDDILVHGKDLESHDQTLRQVLQKMSDAGLTLNREKCEFGSRSVRFLGHIIDENGVAADPAKVSAIVNYPSPTSKTELRRVNGMLNQLSKFIPNLTSLTAPMRELLKKSRDWLWDVPQEKAFAEIKKAFTSTQHNH